MAKAIVYSPTGSKGTTEVTLPKEVFGVAIKNHVLLASAYRSYLAAGRSAKAKTKTRGMVSGSRRKHHRQKGTGAARAGTVQSPIRVGGGVAFGPTGNENYQLKLSVKAKNQAVRQALTLKAANGQVIIIDELVAADGKTKVIATLLQKLGLERQVLLVVDSKTPELTRAVRNIANAQLVNANYLNVFKVINAESIAITKNGLKVLQQWLGTASSKQGAKS